ncbi:hypothetical protein ACHAXH_003119 [Discostella pseudostelligera]
MDQGSPISKSASRIHLYPKSLSPSSRIESNAAIADKRNDGDLGCSPSLIFPSWSNFVDAPNPPSEYFVVACDVVFCLTLTHHTDPD